MMGVEKYLDLVFQSNVLTPSLMVHKSISYGYTTGKHRAQCTGVALIVHKCKKIADAAAVAAARQQPS
jgi:hypothetical protein